MFGFGAAPPVEDQEVELDFEAESWRSSGASGSVDSSSSSSSSISSGDSYLHCHLCAAEVAEAIDSGYQLNSDGRSLIGNNYFIQGGSKQSLGQICTKIIDLPGTETNDHSLCATLFNSAPLSNSLVLI